MTLEKVLFLVHFVGTFAFFAGISWISPESHSKWKIVADLYNSFEISKARVKTRNT